MSIFAKIFRNAITHPAPAAPTPRCDCGICYDCQWRYEMTAADEAMTKWGW